MQPTHPTPLEAAILKTLLYADVFHYPMMPAEIHHYLIGHGASREQVEQALIESAWLQSRVVRVNGYFAMTDAFAEVRHYRSEVSDELWQKALRYGKLLAYFPFVRMVALTGALSMRNADSPDDDLDFMLVTTPGRVWLARGFMVLMVRLARLWGVELCPNYVVSSAELVQPRQDMYIAHELAQMIPISGHGIYQQMRHENPWLADYLPNAQHAFYPTPAHRPHGWGAALQKATEWLLSGRVGEWLNAWEHRRKASQFAQEEAQNPHSAAVITPEQVKGHFNDYGHPVLNQFAERLRRHGLE